MSNPVWNSKNFSHSCQTSMQFCCVARTSYRFVREENPCKFNVNKMDSDNSCVIRVRLYDKTKYVKISKKDVANWELFLRAGEYTIFCRIHNLKLSLITNEHFQLQSNSVLILILWAMFWSGMVPIHQFHKIYSVPSSCNICNATVFASNWASSRTRTNLYWCKSVLIFFLFILKPQTFSWINMFLIQELKYFLLENGCRGVFLEANCDENGNEVQLSDETFNFLTQKLMDFIDVKYSLYRRIYPHFDFNL